MPASSHAYITAVQRRQEFNRQWEHIRALTMQLHRLVGPQIHTAIAQTVPASATYPQIVAALEAAIAYARNPGQETKVGYVLAFDAFGAVAHEFSLPQKPAPVTTSAAQNP